MRAPPSGDDSDDLVETIFGRGVEQVLKYAAPSCLPMAQMEGSPRSIVTSKCAGSAAAKFQDVGSGGGPI